MKSTVFFHIIILIIIIFIVTCSQIAIAYGDNVIMQVNQPVNPALRSSPVDISVQSSLGTQSPSLGADGVIVNPGQVIQPAIPNMRTPLVDKPTQLATGIRVPPVQGNVDLLTKGNTGPIPIPPESLGDVELPPGMSGMKKTRAYDSYLNYLKQGNKVSMASRAQNDDIISFPYNADKKIIEFGTDAPTARWVKNNVASMEQQPFDGVAFFPGNDKLNIWMPDAWRNNPDQFDLASLSAIKWNKFQGNNFLLLFSDRNEWYYLDYWDDSNWTQIEANMGALAKAARDNGCAGILFDTEYYYTKSPWSYADNNKGHTLVETQAQIRVRGAQVMRAWQTQYPDITILFTSATESSANYNLLPYWVNGMLDVIGPDVRLVDGNEYTYYLQDTIDWFNQYDKLKVSKDRVAYLSPANEAKWVKNVEVGTAMYWELSKLLEGRYPNTAQIIKDRWEHNAYIGLVTTDKWVWTFSHDINWWGVPIEDQPMRCNMKITGVPAAAADGIRNAKNKYFTHQKLGWDIEGYLPETSATVHITNTNPVTVNATTTNGDVYRVDFYLNNVLVDSATTKPYTTTLTNIPPGRYSLIAQAQIWSNSDSKNYSGTSQPVEIILPLTQSTPTITSISPNSGKNSGDVSAIISGTNFITGATVKLTQSGQPDILATSVIISAPNKITCKFPITGKPAGTWNVVVTSGGQTVSKINSFTISPSVSSSTNIGVFRGKTWSLDYDGNGYWNAGDKSAVFGIGDSKDKPVTGDWNGDGRTKIGVLRGNVWYVDYNGNGYWDTGDKSAVFGIGDGKDKPVTGDWNGDGKTNIGVLRGNVWYVDYNGNGYWDSGDKTAVFGIGDGQDTPVTGDWYGDGKTNIGVLRGNVWYVDYNGNGYWDTGDKTATFGIGDGKDKPVTGDWNGDGKTNIGVFRGKTWSLDYNGNGYWDSGDKTANFGIGDGNDVPVTGRWSGVGVASFESGEIIQVHEPVQPIQLPTVTRLELELPHVETPVKSSTAVSPMMGGGILPPQNPLVTGSGVHSPGKLAL